MTSTTSHGVSIVGAAQAPYTRHPDPARTTQDVLAHAARLALENAGLTPQEVDGLGISSFTLGPDHAVDFAWRLGLRLNWLMEDTNGGASGGGLLQHAVRAIEAGDASVVLLIGGDHFGSGDFADLVRGYNQATIDHLVPLPATGPNALFAMLTQRQMNKLQLSKRDYGNLVVAQREWASRNPGATYRTQLTIEDYLEAPTVSDPLGRYDCVPPVTGADAVVVTVDDRVPGRRARVLAVTTKYNADHQTEDGLRTAVADCAPKAWELSGVDPQDIEVASVYDDYPAMIVAQLIDLGITSESQITKFIAEQVVSRRFPLNTSGGQLSAGQAGAGAGLHGLVEVAKQLRGQAEGRQTQANLGVVSGYGMVLYRYGACGNVTVLEAAA